MAWTKTKTAIVVVAAAILAVSTATVVVKVSFFPKIKDSYFQPNYRHFQNLPSDLFVLRPTHFSTPTDGLDYSAEGSSKSGEHVTRMMGRNRSFEQLIARIYVCGQSQIVFPAIVPKDHFDYLFTILDNHARERFEAVIKNKLGYVASWQEHNTEVFMLKVQTPNSPGLKPSSPSNNSPIRQNSQNQLEFRNRSLLDLAHEIGTSASIPVMDETGLTDSFNFDLDCTQADLANRNWDNVNHALHRLGLELVSTNMPMNMLVVEKVQ